MAYYHWICLSHEPNLVIEPECRGEELGGMRRHYGNREAITEAAQTLRDLDFDIWNFASWDQRAIAAFLLHPTCQLAAIDDESHRVVEF